MKHVLKLISRLKQSAVFVSVSWYLLIHSIVGVVLFGALAVLWSISRTTSKKLADFQVKALNLPDDLAQWLGQTISVIYETPIVEIAWITIKILLLLLAPLIVARIITAIIDIIIGKIIGEEYLVKTRAEYRLDRRVGIVFLLPSYITVLLVIVFIGIIFESMSTLTFFSLLISLLFVALIFWLTLYLSRYSRLINKSKAASRDFALYMSNPARRLRISINMTLIILVVWFFFDVTAPLLFEKLRMLPQRTYEISMRKMEQMDTEALHRELLDYVQNRMPERNLLSERALRWYVDTSMDDILNLPNQLRDSFEEVIGKELSDDIIQGLHEKLVVLLGTVLAFMILFEAFAPLIIIGYTFRGWRGIYRQLPHVSRAFITVLPAIPIAFALDKIGIISDRPILWLFVILVVYVSDAILSASSLAGGRSVLVVAGSTKYHLRRTCPRLDKVSGDRIRPIRKASASEIGFAVCKVCSPDDDIL